MPESECRPLNIALISYHGCPVAQFGEKDTGGMNVYVANLAKYLGELGHNVDVFTRFHDVTDPTVVEISENVQLIHLKAGPTNASKLDLPEYVSKFVCNLLEYNDKSEINYDVIHSHYWLSGVVGDSLKEKWDVPHISTFHTLAKTKLRARPGEIEPQIRFDSEQKIMHSCDHVLVMTEAESNDIQHLYDVSSTKISVIPAGVDVEMFKPISQDLAREELGLGHGNILLFVGRIDPIKGLDILLESVAMLLDYVDFHLVIVGGNLQLDEDTQNLKRKITELNLDSSVTLIGSVPQHKLPYFYSASDLLVLPSHYESFGFVALESMSCGRPVVASRVGGLPSFVDHGVTGYLVPWRCPEPFGDKIEILFKNENLRHFMGGKAREKALTMSWENMSKYVAQIYMDIAVKYPVRNSVHMNV